MRVWTRFRPPEDIVNITPVTSLAERVAIMARLLRAVARHQRLSPQDVEDFVQSSHLRLLGRGYDIFDRFKGRSSLQTYLTVVATRLLLDWRTSQYGKWRPSAAAARLGPAAIEMERLMHRDGRSLDEAIEALCSADKRLLPAELRHVAGQLRARPSRRMASVEEGHQPVHASTDFDDPVEHEERMRMAQTTRRVLTRAIQQLPADEQRLVRLRFGQNRPIPVVARTLHTPAALLYRRLSRVLRSLRRALQEAGVTESCVR
jgi:RNA polymerase sigma factor (sigma-70 family)